MLTRNFLSVSFYNFKGYKWNPKPINLLTTSIYLDKCFRTSLLLLTKFNDYKWNPKLISNQSAESFGEWDYDEKFQLIAPLLIEVYNDVASFCKLINLFRFSSIFFIKIYFKA